MKKIVNTKLSPEAIIQKAFLKLLRGYGWFAKETHGNAYQSGFPDIFACHTRYGQRWVECKCPTRYSFTAAQRRDFPLISANGSGIWIVTAATEHEYQKLFSGENWFLYWK